jgi:hypothetical protein
MGRGGGDLFHCLLDGSVWERGVEQRQVVAVSVVVSAALLIARLHRKVLSQCQQLQGQMSRAEDAQVGLQTSLADLMATLNLSLASLAKGRDEVDGREIECIRAAAQKAIEGATKVGTRRS